MAGPITYIVIGAGSRGTIYASYALAHREDAKVVGVAEPREEARNRLVKEHGITPENTFNDWRDVASVPRMADAAVIATQDGMHTDPVVALAEKGYHLLLEKPMAPTAAECQRIVDSVKSSGVMLAIAHVLLYTRYTQTIKQILDSGRIGDVVSIQRLEPVGYWHQAHSFVRGNWRKESEATFMLMAKCCHDIDWIRYIMGQKCERVSSFGGLKHFRKAEKPAKAGDAMRCTDCAYESECPYSAKKQYINAIKQGYTGWPVDVITFNTTEEGVMEALSTGPYGRCVFECDNDVVDNQVVSMAFAGGRTASLTMTAFTEGGSSGHRRTSIFGTRGELRGDGCKLWVTDFLTDKTEVIDTESSAGSILGGHGGGDDALMYSFVKAIASNDRSVLLSGPDETLESHLMVFAAEQARLANQVVNLRDARLDW
ncbi:unnamed protein product [Choristocarpus tenellus]